MKHLIHILFLFCAFLGIAQQGNNVIKIRAIKYDTSYYNQLQTDTLDIFQGTVRSHVPFDASQNVMGHWHNNVFFDSERAHVFGHQISDRMKKLARTNPEKFWNKINRLVAKNKTKVFSTWYQLRQQIAYKQLIKYNKTYAYVWNPETNQQVIQQAVAIDSSVVSIDSLDISTFVFLSGNDTVQLIGNLFNVTAICRNSSDLNFCVFRTLIGNLEAYYRRNRPFGYFLSTSIIDQNKYSLYFKFENFLVNKVAIVQNLKLKYYCNFKVDQDSIFILNSPTTQFERGKIARKKNKIRFRYLNRGYNFYLKKEPVFPTRLLTPRRNSTSHYGLAIAN